MAPQPTIGQLVDDAMSAIERDNPSLKGVLPKDYARPGLDKQRLGQLINLVSDIGLGSPADRAKDMLGRVYEYFLAQFRQRRRQEGRPVLHAVARRPCAGRDARALQGPRLRPLLRLRRHVRAEREVHRSARRQARRHFHLRPGVELHHLAARQDEPRHPRHRRRRSPTATPSTTIATRTSRPTTSSPIRPSTTRDWRGELLKDDKRWVYGVPPAGNANFAWVQHFIYHLAPTGLAGFVLANGSMSSNQSGEGEIRKAIIEADLVDCMVALPGQLFYSTQIPVCLWFLARSKKNGRFRDRRGETLFIDARKMGTLIDRVHRELSDEEIAKIANTYHAWRGDKNSGVYADISGFCKSAKLDGQSRGLLCQPGSSAARSETFHGAEA